MFTEFAPAKINLSLRVHNRRSDGFHDLTSLVAFADVGDRISFAPSDRAGGSLTLAYTGDYGGDLQQALDGDDVVLSAARLFGAGIAGVLTLEKNLPVMAGMGGGSADAAAVLRLFQRLHGQSHHDRAVELGSDVPVCLLSRAAWMRGRGEQVAALTAFPECPAVLVNAGIAMPTGPVFHALERDRPEAADAMTTPGGFADLDAVVAHLRAHGNDLLTPALSLAPEIRQVLENIDESGAVVSGMSGSGATCFGLYQSRHDAELGAEALSNHYPEGFVRATVLN
ncbi:MAG: 4-(cytidine 5'-diphospho)-2-C-methyl-D-erythritol kinase [Parvibaculales bacterium]